MEPWVPPASHSSISPVWLGLCPVYSMSARICELNSHLMLEQKHSRPMTDLSPSHLLTLREGRVLSPFWAFVMFVFLLGHLFCPLTDTGCLAFVF